MAESDSILQLGIEAARDGNREEARNLFRLLTRQDPSNSQAWLWLAGVAENRDERQAALERVVDLDPNNEMALKGLQQLGVRPQARARDEASAPTISSSVHEAEPPIIVPPTPVEEPDSRARYDIDDDDPYAALDTLSDAMAESPAAVRRTDPEPSDIDALDDDGEPGDADADRPDWRRRSARGTTRSRTLVEDEDEETVPARRGVSPLLLGIVILALVLLLALLAWPLLRGGSSGGVAGTGDSQAATDTALTGTSGTSSGVDADATAAAGGAGLPGAATSVISGTVIGEATVIPGAATAVVSGTVSGPGEATAVPGGVVPAPGEATAVPAGPAPAAGEATAPPAVQPPASAGPDPATANPAIVAANSPQESNGWLYDFNQPSFAAVLNGGLGAAQPQGRFAVVLAFLANRTGTAQAIPADFFVLKDAQGRVYTPNVDASNAYVQRGINADLGVQDAVPPDGLTRSIALVFDVQPDATNLVFFARSKPDQGWQVLTGVQ